MAIGKLGILAFFPLGVEPEYQGELELDNGTLTPKTWPEVYWM